ncbi:MAG: hypothetical protein NT030_00215 [Candidatus Saganbacteria bacterium]|nr:hypothetical protein [Candidatus Saganbacteria bacterium]
MVKIGETHRKPVNLSNPCKPEIKSSVSHFLKAIKENRRALGSARLPDNHLASLNLVLEDFKMNDPVNISEKLNVEVDLKFIGATTESMETVFAARDDAINNLMSLLKNTFYLYEFNQTSKARLIQFPVIGLGYKVSFSVIRNIINIGGE